MKDEDITKEQLINELTSLCIRNDESGKTELNCRLAEEKLNKISRQNELILNSTGEGILGLDINGNHTFINPAAADMLGYKIGELLGNHSHSIWHHTKADGSPYPEQDCPIYKAFKDGAIYHNVRDEVFWRKDNSSFQVAYTSTPIIDDGNIVGAVLTFRDITERKQAEERLKKAYDELEEKVRERTSELFNANTALRVLLKQREEDKKEQEERILSNVRELIMPCVEQLKKSGMSSKYESYLSLLESNLLEIISPFSIKLSSKYLNLTNKEILVANFIKGGNSTKELPEIFNVSKATIDTHRQNIREKLGLNSTKTNLRTYLLSIK